MKNRVKSFAVVFLAAIMITIMLSGITASADVQRSWIKFGNSWYYTDSIPGSPYTGWLQYGSGWYYLSPTTGTAVTGWQKVDGKWYYLDPYAGTAKTGWVGYAGHYYYLSPVDGTVQTGWQQIDGKYYYLDPFYGYAVTGWVNYAGNYYYLSPTDGTVQVGWLQSGGNWYYLSPENGTVQVGWLQLGSKIYYLDPRTGTVMAGNVTINGATFALDPLNGTAQYVSGAKGQQDRVGLGMPDGGEVGEDGEFGSTITRQFILTFKVNGSPVSNYTVSNSNDNAITVTKQTDGTMLLQVVNNGNSKITITYGGKVYYFYWTEGPGGGGQNPPVSTELTLSGLGPGEMGAGTGFGTEMTPVELTVKYNGTPITNYSYSNSNNSAILLSKLPDGKLQIQRIGNGTSDIIISYNGKDYKFHWQRGPGAQ